MKYLKYFEKLTKEEELFLMNKIKTTLDELSDYEYDSIPELKDCPFTTELNIIHQKEYINSIFRDVTNWDIDNLTFNEFRDTYKKLLIESKKIILQYLTENPELYTEYKDFININVPDEIIMKAKQLSTAKNYNL